MLPADSHVHAEWSWDAQFGSMSDTCQQAVQRGVPAVAFTEHLDHTTWQVDPATFPERFQSRIVNGTFTPPPMDVRGYLGAVGWWSLSTCGPTMTHRA